MSAAQPVQLGRTARVWNIRDWRMGHKLLAAFLSATLVPLLATSIVAYQTSREAMLTQGTTSLTVHGTNTAANVDRYLIARHDDISAISELTTLSSYLLNPKDNQAFSAATTELQAMAKKTDYESIALIDASGTVLLSTLQSDVGTHVATGDYFEQSMAGSTVISDPSISLVTNRPGMFFSAPVRDAKRRIIGVVRSRVTLYGIWGLVEDDKNAAGPGTVGILLDKNGIRIAHSLSLANRDEAEKTILYRAIAPLPADVAKSIVDEKRFGPAAASTVEVLPLPEVAAALAGPTVKTFETTADNSSERYFASTSALTVKPWRYVVMTPMSTFTGAADSLRLYFAAAAVLIAALTVILVVLFARTITQPIIHLTKVADSISLGDLSAKIEIDQKDEIGELAEAISRMQASLLGAINRLRARRTPTA